MTEVRRDRRQKDVRLSRSATEFRQPLQQPLISLQKQRLTFLTATRTEVALCRQWVRHRSQIR